MNYKNLTLAGLFILLAQPVLAQTLLPVGKGSFELSEVALPKNATQSKDALQVAVSVPLNLGLVDGLWEKSFAGQRWSLRLHAAGAQHLSVLLEQVRLPRDAELWLESADGVVRQGPYTQDSIKSGDRIWTAIVPGDTAQLVLTRPLFAAGDEPSFKIAAVHYGFVDLLGVTKTTGKAAPTQGGSGSCEQDVACPAGNSWANEQRAIGLMVINGTTVCTGNLINSTANDLTPYFLTASHCGFSGGIATAESAAASVVVYWLYQRTACGTGSGDLTKNQTGATLLSTHPAAAPNNSDHALLVLDAVPSASFTPYYAGLDAVTTVSPGNGATIHHPVNDVKKISIPNAVVKNGNGYQWNVQWASGVTEGGSSGSGLFSSAKKIVGVLTGGLVGSGSSCAAPTAQDVYGITASDWEYSTTDLSQQLRNRIDNASTCENTTNGRDYVVGAGIPVASACADGGAIVPSATLALSTANTTVGSTFNLQLSLTNSRSSSRVNQVVARIPAFAGFTMGKPTAPASSVSDTNCGYGASLVNSSTGAVDLKHFSVKGGSTCTFVIPMTANSVGTFALTLPAGTVKTGVGTVNTVLSQTIVVSAAPTSTNRGTGGALGWILIIPALLMAGLRRVLI